MSILTRGLGAVGVLPTAGMGFSGDVVVQAPARRGGWLPDGRKPRWKRRDEERQRLEDAIADVYADIAGLRRPAIAQMVRPYTEGQRKPAVVVPKWERVHVERMSLQSARALLDALEEARDEEDAAVLLLMH